MPPVEFELAVPGSERPQTYALDRAATKLFLITPQTFHLSSEKSETHLKKLKRYSSLGFRWRFH